MIWQISPTIEIGWRMLVKFASPSMIAFRPYQNDALAALEQYWNAGGTAALIDMATATGKSLVLAETMRRAIAERHRRQRLAGKAQQSDAEPTEHRAAIAPAGRSIGSGGVPACLTEPSRARGSSHRSSSQGCYVLQCGTSSGARSEEASDDQSHIR